MSCKDCLIWVGQSYKTVGSFIKEAEKRGCCRKVPFWPSWAIPGETRVFLAHPDGSERTDQGSIFGYFYLYGVDIILNQKDIDTYKGLIERHRQTRARSDLIQLIQFWSKKFPRGGLPVNFSSSTSSDGDDDALIDFLLDVLISCETEPSPNGGGGYIISNDQTTLEEGRLCSEEVGGVRRIIFRVSDEEIYRPPLYFVDVLTRTIDTFFCDLLKELIKELLKKGECETKEECFEKLEKIAAIKGADGCRRGIDQVQAALQKVSEMKREWVIPPKGMKDHVEIHGALITFKEPYPVYRRMPQAAFQGIERIDGDNLLKKIAEKYKGAISVVKLPLCLGDADNNKPKTVDQLVACIARELDITKSFAKQILDTIPEIVKNELKQTCRFKLPNLGTFSVVQRKATKGINPQTGGIINIPAKKVVRFKPYKNLKDGVKNIVCPDEKSQT
jgi:DNA-binding protein HU-beta